MSRNGKPWIGTFVLGILISIALAITMIWTTRAYYWGGENSLGPEQPIPFSHRLHVTDKDIDCRFCHTGVDRIHQAGLPPVQTCMHCHQVIITEHPEIRRLRNYYDSDEPVPWQRVFVVPDHVYFTHRVHTNIGELECEDCHGPIGEMDRLFQPRKMEMGFCLECHRPRGASVDCWTCHQ